MCGIAGIFNYKHDEEILMNSLKSMQHRGPDGIHTKYYLNKGVSLGHCRLSIIDISDQANLPMTYEDSQLWLTFNGEIYNFIELRTELMNMGYKFYTQSDSEVVLVSFIQWGLEAFFKFNGMWAMAIYDLNNHSILLSRDRFGVKPLYYYTINNQLFFASELKAFLPLKNELSLAYDQNSIKLLLVNPAYLEPTGRTWMKNINSLLPGHHLSFNMQNSTLINWWKTYEHVDSLNISYTDAVEQFKMLFTDSCKLRMRSDVPIASSLSGGIDSASVVATINKIAKHSNGERQAKVWQHAFTSSLPKSELDETKDAIKLANHFNLNHHLSYSSEFDDSMLDKMLYHCEYPFMTPPNSMWALYKCQNENGIKVSLDGHGSDELFGGYHFNLDYLLDHTSILKMDYWNYIKLRLVMNNDFNAASMIKSIVKTKLLSRNMIDFINNKFYKHSYLKNHSNIEIDDSSHRHQYDSDDFNQYLYKIFHFDVLPRILKNFDIISMAHSIEVRMPFLDYRLVCFLFSLPYNYKVSPHYTKRLLRDSMSDRLQPHTLLNKRKIGFNSPVHEWLQTKLHDWSVHTLETAHPMFSEIIDIKRLRNTILDKSSNLNWSKAMEVFKCLNTIRLIYLTNS